MTVAIEDEDSEYWFTLRPARRRRIGNQKLADVEFADDFALITDTDSIEGENEIFAVTFYRKKVV